MSEIWWTAVLEQPDGRVVGVSYAGTRGPTVTMPGHVERLPRGAEIRYRTRPQRHANEAYEQARHRTVHHNLWHDGSGFTAGHRKADCHRSEHLVGA